jgi:DEAD/DEAH box helicase domain-containing protein
VVCNGHVMETLDRGQAFREAHPGAVLLHQGETFIVEDMDLGTQRIRVRKEEVDYFTEVQKSVETTVIKERKQRESGGVVISYGDVEVVERFHGYHVRHNDITISSESLDLPPIAFATQAVWFGVPEEVANMVVEQQRDLAGGLHGAEHAIIGMMPFHVLCDRWDIGGFSAAWYPATRAPTILVYDGCEGGTGLAEKAYELLPLILRTAHELVRDCNCEGGCPACILSPKCGNDNRPLDKAAARILLEKVSASLMKDADEVQDYDRTR